MSERLFIHMSLKLIITLLLPAHMLFSQAQDTSPSTAASGFWMNIGMGIGVNDYGGAPSAGLSFSFDIDGHLVSIRSVHHLQKRGGGGGFLSFSAPKYFGDVGILYGRVLHTETYTASLAAGLGLTLGGRSPREEGSIGIPLEVQFFLSPGSAVRFGLYGYGILYRRVGIIRSFGGLQLSLQFALS